MATMTVELTQAELREAVVAWLSEKGFKVTGEVTLTYAADDGDPRGSGPTFSASAAVEPIIARKRSRP